MAYQEKIEPGRTCRKAGYWQTIDPEAGSRSWSREDTIATIAEALDIPIDKLKSFHNEIMESTIPANNSFDWCFHVHERINDFFSDWFLDTLIRNGTRCETEDDVHLDVHMIMAGGGRHLCDSNEEMTDEEAIRYAEIRTGISYEDYFEKTLEVWQSSLGLSLSPSAMPGGLLASESCH